MQARHIFFTTVKILALIYVLAQVLYALSSKSFTWEIPSRFQPTPGHVWARDSFWLFACTWQPGLPLPGRPGLEAAAKEDHWQPKPGFIWLGVPFAGAQAREARKRNDARGLAVSAVTSIPKPAQSVPEYKTPYPAPQVNKQPDPFTADIGSLTPGTNHAVPRPGQSAQANQPAQANPSAQAGQSGQSGPGNQPHSPQATYPAPPVPYWASGLLLRRGAHVIPSEIEQMWRPEPGYQWTRVDNSPNQVKDVNGQNLRALGNLLGMQVQWVAGITAVEYPHFISDETEGYWKPLPGYRYRANNRRELEWASGLTHSSKPNQITGKKEGQWLPMPGYSQQKRHGKTVIEWTPGLPHNKQACMLAGDKPGHWRTVPGHHLEKAASGNFIVVRNPGFEAESDACDQHDLGPEFR